MIGWVLRWLPLALVSAPSLALANGLRYDVAAGCPGQSRFEEQVADDCDLELLDMNITVQREGSGFRLKLLVQGDEGGYPEDKTAKHCEQLIELAAHVARRVCQPKAEPETTTTEATRPSRSVTTPVDIAPHDVTQARVPRDSTTIEDADLAAGLAERLWLAVGPFAQTDVDLGSDAGVALDLGIELGDHSLALGGSVWFPSEVEVELGPGNTTPLELSRFSFRLQDCLRSATPRRVRVGHWGFGVCFDAGYQVVSSRFPAGTQPRDYRSWPSVGASLSALRKFSRHLVVEGHLGGDFNIAAEPVTAQPFGAVHEFATVAGVAGARLIWLFDPPPVPFARKSEPSAGEPRESAATRALSDRDAW